MAEVLICCSGADRELARAVGALVEALGHSVWWDPEPSIEGNEEHNQFLLDLLVGDATVVVVILSTTAVNCDWVRLAVEAGMSKPLIALMTNEVRAEELPPLGVAFRPVVALSVDDEVGFIRALTDALARQQTQEPTG
jgi:Trk K+ transport system NAD-binding subunit